MDKLTLITGDKVIMEGCYEATLPEYKNKVWVCRTDSFIAKCGDEVVFLEGFSGYFMACYLRKVDVNTLEGVSHE